MPKRSEKAIKNRNAIRDIETFYANGLVDNLGENLETAKKNVVREMTEYASLHRTNINPLVINNLFFKPITKKSCFSPDYNAEKLALVYDYYNFLITNINDKIGTYPSSIASFCKLASISTNKLRGYKSSEDERMREVVQMIYDQIGDDNISMGQLDKVNSTMTTFKMKVQNDLNDKKNNNEQTNFNNFVNPELLEMKLEKYKLLLNEKNTETKVQEEDGIDG